MVLNAYILNATHTGQIGMCGTNCDIIEYTYSEWNTQMKINGQTGMGIRMGLFNEYLHNE